MERRNNEQLEGFALKPDIKCTADDSDDLDRLSVDDLVRLFEQQSISKTSDKDDKAIKEDGIPSTGTVHKEVDTSLSVDKAYYTSYARQIVDDGNRLLRQQNVEEAISKYDQAIKECPYSAAPHYNKRIALSMQHEGSHKNPLPETLPSNDSPKKVCNLASKMDPHFVINVTAFVPERTFSDDSSSEEDDEEFRQLCKDIKNEWPFTTKPKKNTKLKTELESVDKFLNENQNTADSMVVYPLLSKISENGFEEHDKDKLSTIAVSIGLNRMYSLSDRKNRSLILELKNSVDKTDIKIKKFGYYWRCIWYTKDGTEAKFEDVKKFYKQLKKKSPRLAKSFIERQERNAESNVPYQRIREYSKNHPETIKLIKGFRDIKPAATIYLHIVDADVLDFNGVYSAYLRILNDCYEPPTVMSTGYEYSKDPQNMAYYLLGHMERMHRVITTFHIPLGTYYPEPNMCILIPQNCETVEESFINHNRGNGSCLESPILINNIKNKRNNVHVIFSEDNPIITNIPSRAKLSKTKKSSLNFSFEFNNGPAAPTSDDIEKYNQVSQSHSNTLTWSHGLFMNKNIQYNESDESFGRIYNKKHELIKRVDHQCNHLVANIRNGVDIENSRSELVKRIGMDITNNVVNAIENITKFCEYFNKKYKRTSKEQDLLNIFQKRKVSCNNLSRKSLLMMVNSPIMDSIKDNIIKLEQLIKLDEKIFEFILNNDEIVQALRNEEINLDDLENCLTNDEDNFDNASAALLMIINSSIMILIRDDIIELQQLIKMDEKILEFILNNDDDIIKVLYSDNHSIDFDEMEYCLTNNYANIEPALNKGYSVHDIFKRYQEDPLHLEFMGADDPVDIVRKNSDDDYIVKFAIDNEYVDENDINAIEHEIMDDEEDYVPATYTEFETELLRRNRDHNDHNDHNDSSDWMQMIELDIFE